MYDRILESKNIYIFLYLIVKKYKVDEINLKIQARLYFNQDFSK
jgi:hypothetical protein